MDVTPEDPRYIARGALHLPSRSARNQGLLHLVVVGERRDRYQSSACIIWVARLCLSAMMTPCMIRLEELKTYKAASLSETISSSELQQGPQPLILYYVF